MSQVSNLPQILSQISTVEKVQQVQQVHGDSEQSRLAGQAQKKAERKRRSVPNAPPSETVELSIPEKREEKKNRREGSRRRSLPEEDRPEPEGPEEGARQHVDLRV